MKFSRKMRQINRKKTVCRSPRARKNPKSPEHIQKIRAQLVPISVKSSTQFMDLNDYCIDEICKWLPLKSLASFGSTCTRLNSIASGYFRRQHSANYIVISSSQGKIYLSPDQPYVHCFSNAFKIIMIHGNDLNLFHFIANKFKDKTLTKVSLFGGNDLTENHAQIISEILSRAKTIELIRCSTVGSLYDILKYCSNMKTLVLKCITECKQHGQINQWLLQKYASLKHLHCERMAPIQLNHFIQQNSTVDSVYGNEFLIEQILKDNIKLNSMVLKLELNRFHGMIFQNLQRIDEQTCRTLYLIGNFVNLHPTFSILRNVGGVSSDRINVNTLSILFPNLKLLKTGINSMVQAKNIAIQLNNLEEVYIDVKHIDYILPFVRYATKLKKIYINNTTLIKNKIKLCQINLHKERNKLEHAEKLVVYLMEEAYLKIEYTSKYSNSLIHVKTIESHVSNNDFVNTILDK